MHQVVAPVKTTRARQMLDVSRESAHNFRKKFSGKTLPVLWEQKNKDGLWTGLTGNYIRVSTRSSEDLTNRIKPFRLS
jgi:threonylcarbamoyladenosine tRNA methylthiotransferase MtaB